MRGEGKPCLNKNPSYELKHLYDQDLRFLQEIHSFILVLWLCQRVLWMFWGFSLDSQVRFLLSCAMPPDRFWVTAASQAEENTRYLNAQRKQQGSIFSISLRPCLTWDKSAGCDFSSEPSHLLTRSCVPEILQAF